MRATRAASRAAFYLGLSSIPIGLGLYYLYPLDMIYFFWDQHYLLNKSAYGNYFFQFVPAQGLGVYGATLPWLIYYFIPFFAPSPAAGQILLMTAMFFVAFWGIYLLISEVAQEGGGRLGLCLRVVLSVFYLVSVEVQINVLRVMLPHGMFWAFVPLNLFALIRSCRRGSPAYYLLYLVSLIFLLPAFAHPAFFLNYVLVLSIFAVYLVIRRSFTIRRALIIALLLVSVLLPHAVQMYFTHQHVAERIYSLKETHDPIALKGAFFDTVPERFSLHNIYRLNFYSELFVDKPDNYLKVNYSNYDGIFFLYFVFLALMIYPFLTDRYSSRREHALFLASLLFSISFLALFRGPLWMVFEYLYGWQHEVFVLYRYIDGKFGAVFHLLLVTCLGVSCMVFVRKAKVLFLLVLIVSATLYLYFEKPYLPANSKITIPNEFSATCDYLKGNTHRSIKYPYRRYHVAGVSLANGITAMSNDVLSELCDHNILVGPSSDAVVEEEVRHMYDTLHDDKESFLRYLEKYAIDSLIVDKKYTPSPFYNIQSIHDKQRSAEKIARMYGEHQIVDNDYFAVYKFSDKRLIEIDSGGVDIIRISPTHYRLRLSNVSRPSAVKLNYTFHNWILTVDEDILDPFRANDFPHFLANGYANGWTIDPSFIRRTFAQSTYKEKADGSLDIDVTLFFKPQSYFYLSLMVSGLAILIGAVLTGFEYLSNRKASRTTS